MKNMLRGLILESLYEAGKLQPITTEAKSDMEPATAATVEALAKLGLKKSEAFGNKEVIRKALEPVIDRYGGELKGQLIGVGGALVGFVGIDKKGQIHPLIKKLFGLRGMTSEKLKASNPELYTQISQIGPFVREVAYDLHHNWGESGFFGPKMIKAYMASKQGGGSLEEGEGGSEKYIVEALSQVRMKMPKTFAKYGHEIMEAVVTEAVEIGYDPKWGENASGVLGVEEDFGVPRKTALKIFKLCEPYNKAWEATAD
jgi:hypothetical protein